VATARLRPLRPDIGSPSLPAQARSWFGRYGQVAACGFNVRTVGLSPSQTYVREDQRRLMQVSTRLEVARELRHSIFLQAFPSDLTVLMLASDVFDQAKARPYPGRACTPDTLVDTWLAGGTRRALPQWAARRR